MEIKTWCTPRALINSKSWQLWPSLKLLCVGTRLNPVFQLRSGFSYAEVPCYGISQKGPLPHLWLAQFFAVSSSVQKQLDMTAALLLKYYNYQSWQRLYFINRVCGFTKNWVRRSSGNSPSKHPNACPADPTNTAPIEVRFHKHHLWSTSVVAPTSRNQRNV